MLNLLRRQLAWVVQLRWIAGIAVILGGLLDLTWLHLYLSDRQIMTAGAAILGYNALFWQFSRRPRLDRGQLYWLVWGQMLADLACLTLLVMWTDRDASPLRGLFVFHMVFASLLLPRVMAFAVSLIAIGMVEGLLVAGGAGYASGLPAAIALSAGWDLTLLATVYLASRVARDLRRQRRTAARQHRRVQRMAERLRRQREAMLQHEKMVALGHMAAGVAHEVANPLASMDGLLQLLERRPEKATADNLTRLREQVARIGGIVRQLTTFARPGEGEGVWHLANLNDVLKHALDVLRFDRRLKDVALTTHYDEQVPAIRMQAAAVEQVIINLVINAADAMEGVDSPRLVLSTAIAGDAVEFAVQDNGQGMDERTRARIFEPFFTTKQVGKGTGLGLSVSYSLIKKHEGDITVESTPGQGTTFRVRLPVSRGP